jgi:hypothetical protein
MNVGRTKADGKTSLPSERTGQKHPIHGRGRRIMKKEKVTVVVVSPIDVIFRAL